MSPEALATGGPLGPLGGPLRPREKGLQRTRTGCITCRHRRVKCGEEKPVCKRCQIGNRPCQYGGPPSKKRGPPRTWDTLPALGPRPEGQFSTTQFAPSAAGPSSSTFPQESIPSPRPSTASEDVQHEEPRFSPAFSPGPLFEQGGGEHPPSSFHYQVGGFEPFYPSNPEWFDTLTNGEPSAAALELSDDERQAVEYYVTNANFGFASKPAAYSTYTILKQIADRNLMALHLLLAASLAEMACNPDSRSLGLTAENHYKIGIQQLVTILSSANSSPDPLVIIASFWFMYLYQKRWRRVETRCWPEISDMMATFFKRTGLHFELSSEPPIDTAQSMVGSPLRRAVMARLTVWLYGIDAQACSHGEGGNFSRLIFQSISTAGLLRIFDTSREEFPLRWGKGYPPEMLVDDMTNAPALELLHHTWAILQDINESSVKCPMKPEQMARLLHELDTMRRRYPINLVFHLTESTEQDRGRLLGNCDWAVGNFYAARIYLFRCSLSKKDHLIESGAGGSIAQTVADLLGLLQRTLKSGDHYQTDRMQFALFWAGVESPAGGETGRWIRSQLWRRGLARPLQTIMLEQLELGKRVTIERIRQVCREAREDEPT